MSLLLVVTFVLTTFGSVTASANSVNKSLASNPTATLSMIDDMNLPTLPDGVAGEVRGEFIPWAVVYTMFYGGVALGIVWYKLYPYAVWCSQNCSNVYELSNAYYDVINILRRR